MKLIERVQAYLRPAAHERVAAPPFTLFVPPQPSRAEDAVAIPDLTRVGDHPAPLTELEAHCSERGLLPRVELLDTFAPELPPILVAAGFAETRAWPVLVCTPESVRDPAPIPGLVIVTLSSQSSIQELREGWNANALGFDPAAELASDEQARAFRDTLVSARAFTARLYGVPAGAGMFVDIRNGVVELMGITTLEPYRRRGIAAALTAYATRAAFAAGADLTFLVAESDAAARVYSRIGYRQIGRRCLYTRQ